MVTDVELHVCKAFGQNVTCGEVGSNHTLPVQQGVRIESRDAPGECIMKASLNQDKDSLHADILQSAGNEKSSK